MSKWQSYVGLRRFSRLPRFWRWHVPLTLPLRTVAAGADTAEAAVTVLVGTEVAMGAVAAMDTVGAGVDMAVGTAMGGTVMADGGSVFTIRCGTRCFVMMRT